MPMNSTKEGVLLRANSDGAVFLSLNRPSKLNTLSEAMLAALQDQLDDIAEDPSVRCVVIGAEGRGFCAGHDLQEMRVRGHVPIGIVCGEQFGRLARARLGRCDRHLELGHAVTDRGPSCLHHGSGHLASVAGQLQHVELHRDEQREHVVGRSDCQILTKPRDQRYRARGTAPKFS